MNFHLTRWDNDASRAISPDDKVLRHRDVFVAVAGGSALVSYGVGALEWTAHQPHINIIGVTGTSAGAVAGAYAFNGLLEGGAAHVTKQLDTYCDGMTQFQMSLLPDWYAAAENMHSLFGRHAFFGGVYRAQTAMMRSYQDQFQMHSTHRPNNPYLLQFLTTTAAGRKLDLDAINRATALSFVANSSATPVGSDLWRLPQANERLTSNASFLPDAKPLTIERLAAGGCPAPLGQPVTVDGERQSDGAYISNPHLGKELLDHIEVAKAELLLIRSRPRDNDDPFNRVTNRQLDGLKRSRPHLRLTIIEPREIIVNHDVAMPPALDFSVATTKARRQAGWDDAARILGRAAHPAHPQPPHNAMTGVRAAVA